MEEQCNSALGTAQKHLAILYIVFSSWRMDDFSLGTAHFMLLVLHENLYFQWYLAVLQLHKLSPSSLFPKPTYSRAVSMSVLPWVTKWTHLFSLVRWWIVWNYNLQLMHPRVLAEKMPSLSKKCSVLHSTQDSFLPPQYRYDHRSNSLQLCRSWCFGVFCFPIHLWL